MEQLVEKLGDDYGVDSAMDCLKAGAFLKVAADFANDRGSSSSFSIGKFMTGEAQGHGQKDDGAEEALGSSDQAADEANGPSPAKKNKFWEPQTAQVDCLTECRREFNALQVKMEACLNNLRAAHAEGEDNMKLDRAVFEERVLLLRGRMSAMSSVPRLFLSNGALQAII